VKKPDTSRADHPEPAVARWQLDQRAGAADLLSQSRMARGGGGDFCGLVAIPGGLLGVGLAIALDAAALARDSVPVKPGRAASSLRLSPTFSVSRREVTVGVALRL
jgi:hypothetical protein